MRIRIECTKIPVWCSLSLCSPAGNSGEFFPSGLEIEISFSCFNLMNLRSETTKKLEFLKSIRFNALNELKDHQYKHSHRLQLISTVRISNPADVASTLNRLSSAFAVRFFEFRCKSSCMYSIKTTENFRKHSLDLIFDPGYGSGVTITNVKLN